MYLQIVVCSCFLRIMWKVWNVHTLIVCPVIYWMSIWIHFIAHPKTKINSTRKNSFIISKIENIPLTMTMMIIQRTKPSFVHHILPQIHPFVIPNWHPIVVWRWEELIVTWPPTSSIIYHPMLMRLYPWNNKWHKCYWPSPSLYPPLLPTTTTIIIITVRMKYLYCPN